MLSYFPKYISSRAITIYLVALLAVIMLFMSHVMSWYWFVFGLVSVICFFHFSNTLTKKWGYYSEKLFTKKLFTTAFIIRIVYVIFSYWFYTYMTGQPFEFGAADSVMYQDMAKWTSSLDGIQTMYQAIINSMRGGYSDSGYIFYLANIYKIVGVGVLIPRIIKALLSAWMCVLIYRLAKRNFGESIGRMAAIFCMLMPNLIYYCGLHLKETEMIFLTVAFVERADYAIRSPKFTFGNMILPMLLAGSLFFFRTVLGVTTLFAFFTAIFLSSGKVLKMRKRLALGIWILVTIGYFMGGRIASEVEEVWENKDSNQSTSMEWRAKREGGNQFAKYAGTAVFFPLIFTIPFPTMVNIEHQPNQQSIHGGNYIKNITSFFTILALFLLVFKWKTWKNHLLILSFFGGYLAVIAMSAFAQSERFHLPVLPFALILSAFGVSQMNKKYTKWFNWWTIFIFVAIIGWSWFKLAGRGLA